MSKVAGERYVYKFIDTQAICQFNPELLSATASNNGHPVTKSHRIKSTTTTTTTSSKSHRHHPYNNHNTNNMSHHKTPHHHKIATTTVVHHPIMINQMNYEINSTSNIIINEAGLSMTSSLNYPKSVVETPSVIGGGVGANMASSSSSSSSSSSYTPANSSYYQTVPAMDSPKHHINTDLSTSTPLCTVNNYYKYQTPVNINTKKN